MQHLISDTARLQPAMPLPLNLLGHVDASYTLSRTFMMLPCIPGCEWDRLRTTIPAAFSAFPLCFQFLQTLTDILACELVEISLSLSFSIALTCKKKQINLPNRTTRDPAPAHLSGCLRPSAAGEPAVWSLAASAPVRG